MNLEQLEEMCVKQEAMGLDRLVLTMPAPKSWKSDFNYPTQVRSPFGLCEYGSGVSDPEMVVIYPTVKQVRKYIKKARNQAFYRIVNLGDLKISVQKMTLSEEANYEPSQLLGQRFRTMAEAIQCLKWAAERLNDV